MKLRSVKDIDISHKSVLVRTGFDVPLKSGQVVDDFRIRDALSTIEYLVENRAKIVIISKLGRPDGWDEDFSLLPTAERLAEIMQRKFAVISPGTKRLPDYDIPHVYFFEHNIEKDNPSELLQRMRVGDIAVLENLRFYDGEEKNNKNFARLLASFGQVYVNECFSVSHRHHASFVGVPEFLPAAAGLSLEKEINVLDRVLHHPKKPVVSMIGGVKLADKAAAVENLAKISDHVLLGGGLANLFLEILGYEIGKSVASEKGELKLAKQLWRDHKQKIKLPIDVVVSTSLSGQPECVKIDKVKTRHMILDIGPQTILEYSKFLKTAATMIWSGPLGYFENKTYAHGTFALAHLFAARSRTAKSFGVAGGGETLEVINKLGLASQIGHVSTGGGAMLDYLGGKDLPGLKPLLRGAHS